MFAPAVSAIHVISANARVFHRVSSRSAALSQLNFALPSLPLDALGRALKDKLFRAQNMYLLDAEHTKISVEI
jgi:hypothetical protein